MIMMTMTFIIALPIEIWTHIYNYLDAKDYNVMRHIYHHDLNDKIRCVEIWNYDNQSITLQTDLQNISFYINLRVYHCKYIHCSQLRLLKQQSNLQQLIIMDANNPHGCDHSDGILCCNMCSNTITSQQLPISLKTLHSTYAIKEITHCTQMVSFSFYHHYNNIHIRDCQFPATLKQLTTHGCEWTSKDTKYVAATLPLLSHLTMILPWSFFDHSNDCYIWSASLTHLHLEFAFAKHNTCIKLLFPPSLQSCILKTKNQHWTSPGFPDSLESLDIDGYCPLLSYPSRLQHLSFHYYCDMIHTLCFTIFHHLKSLTFHMHDLGAYTVLQSLLRSMPHLKVLKIIVYYCTYPQAQSCYELDNPELQSVKVDYKFGTHEMIQWILPPSVTHFDNNRTETNYPLVAPNLECLTLKSFGMHDAVAIQTMPRLHTLKFEWMADTDQSLSHLPRTITSLSIGIFFRQYLTQLQHLDHLMDLIITVPHAPKDIVHHLPVHLKTITCCIGERQFTRYPVPVLLKEMSVPILQGRPLITKPPLDMKHSKRKCLIRIN